MTEIRTKSSTGGEKGVKLARFDLIPAGPLKELAEHYGRGARKYANHQWRQGYEWSKSIAALGRHFNDFIGGKDYDVCENDPTGCSHVDTDGNDFPGGETPNGSWCFNHTGSHHMAAVAWHSFLLLEFKDTHAEHDDRFGSEPLFDPEEEAAQILRDRGSEIVRRLTPSKVAEIDAVDSPTPPPAAGGSIQINFDPPAGAAMRSIGHAVAEEAMLRQRRRLDGGFIPQSRLNR